MERQFELISDGSCDLPADYVSANEVTVVPFYVTFDGENYFKEGTQLSVREFYQRMVDDPKTFPKTSMPAIQDYADVFSGFAKEGKAVICICISSKFSGSFQAAVNAREVVLEEYPGARIFVIDARINTVLQGLYVMEAVKLRDAGKEPEESVKILEDIRSSGRIFFTVGNMDYLKAGGRIGKVASLAGSVLGIRPVITLKEGEIFGSGVGRSRRSTVAKSLELLINYVQEIHATPEEYVLDIGYGYDYDEAVAFRKQVVEALGKIGFSTAEKDIPLLLIGAGIAVHTGPHALGVTILRRAL